MADLEIEEFKARVRLLEKDYVTLSVTLFNKIYSLEKTINYLGLATSISFLLSFLLIGHVAKWI